MRFNDTVLIVWRFYVAEQENLLAYNHIFYAYLIV